MDYLLVEAFSADKLVMSRFKHLIGVMLLFAAVPLPATTFAGTRQSVRATVSGPEHLSESEFRTLAEELSQKVSLFQDAWKADPKAEFYGGTTRDFLYWIKGKFRGARNRNDALAIANDLRKIPLIDIRDFIAPDSDIDVVSNQETSLEAHKYGVRRIDAQSPDVFDPKTEAGKNERLQGYVPAEKIRLSKNGFVNHSEFGDGVGEIFSGKLTVHFSSPSDFEKSSYARQKLNHPVLLALRYLRLCAVNYFQEHGSGYPEPATLLGMDAQSKETVQKVIQQASNGKELTPYLKQERFKKWLNGSIQKAFRTYTNPTAAMELMKAFHVDDLVRIYSLEPINQYLFAKNRDPEKVRAQIAKLGVDESKLFEPVSRHFENGMIYHGTRTDQAFRSILLQGILPSDRENVLAGEGLYGVSDVDRHFAENWGGSKDRLVAFDVDPNAKIVDVTQGEGARAWSRFLHKDYDTFADAIGADIIRYPYSTRAYVVKNSAVLSRAEGVYRKVLTLSKALDQASKVRSVDEFWNFLEGTRLAGLNEAERKLIDDELKKSPVFKKIAPDERQAWEIAVEVIDESKEDQRKNGFKALEKLKEQRAIPPQVYDIVADAVLEAHWSVEDPLIEFVTERHPRSMLRILTQFNGTQGRHADFNRITANTISSLIRHGHTTDADIQKAVSEIAIGDHHPFVEDAALAFLGTFKHVNPDEDKVVISRLFRSGRGLGTLQGLVATDPKIVQWLANHDDIETSGQRDGWKALLNQDYRLMTPESLDTVLFKIDSIRGTEREKIEKVSALAALFPEAPPQIADWVVKRLDSPRSYGSVWAAEIALDTRCKDRRCIQALFQKFNASLSDKMPDAALEIAKALVQLDSAAKQTLESVKMLLADPMGMEDSELAELVEQIDQSSIKDPLVLKKSVSILEKLRDGDANARDSFDCGLLTRLQLKLSLK